MFSLFFEEKERKNRYFSRLKSLMSKKTSLFPEISAFFMDKPHFFIDLPEIFQKNHKISISGDEPLQVLQEIIKICLKNQDFWKISFENREQGFETLFFHHFFLVFMQTTDLFFVPPLQKYLLLLEKAIESTSFKCANVDIYLDFVWILLNLFENKGDISQESAYFVDFMGNLWHKSAIFHDGSQGFPAEFSVWTEKILDFSLKKLPKIVGNCAKLLQLLEILCINPKNIKLFTAFNADFPRKLLENLWNLDESSQKNSDFLAKSLQFLTNTSISAENLDTYVKFFTKVPKTLRNSRSLEDFANNLLVFLRKSQTNRGFLIAKILAAHTNPEFSAFLTAEIMDLLLYLPEKELFELINKEFFAFFIASLQNKTEDFLTFYQKTLTSAPILQKLLEQEDFIAKITENSLNPQNLSIFLWFLESFYHEILLNSETQPVFRGQLFKNLDIYLVFLQTVSENTDFHARVFEFLCWFALNVVFQKRELPSFFDFFAENPEKSEIFAINLEEIYTCEVISAFFSYKLKFSLEK